MRRRDGLLVGAIGGIIGVSIGIFFLLDPICSIAIFMMFMALAFMAWDRMGKRAEEGRGSILSSAVGALRKEKDAEGDDEVWEAEVVDDGGDSDPAPPPTREHMTDIYCTVLDLDRDRATTLYDAGYLRLEDLAGVDVETLMKVEMINPTVARKIVRSVDRIFKED